MKNEVVEIELTSLSGPFHDQALLQLAEMLPEHVASRRWYRSKARSIERIAIEDVLKVPRTNSFLFVIKIQHADGEGDRYILPVSLSAQAEVQLDEVMAYASVPDGSKGVVYSALGDSAFRSGLLEAIACESKFEGQRGQVVASRTTAFKERCDSASISKIESFVSRAEQSNTSIIYRDRFILKLFRKLEAGINPDVEIGTFLTEHGFKNTPAVLGSLEYRAVNTQDSYQMGILQQFVPNQGDAWKYTLDSLADFFGKALEGNGKASDIRQGHILDLVDEEIAPEMRSMIGAYLDSAELLGQRTAQMHAVLNNPEGGADFEPEAFTSADAQNLYDSLISQADITFGLLKRKIAAIGSSTADSVRELLKIEHRVAERFAGLRGSTVKAVRIRHHGDYHLGQVLYTGQDFMIIDFEGEPARPIEERRAKALAMRDVAGMVRSFQYAAYAALFGQVPGIPTDEKTQALVEGWAAAWNSAVSTAYLKGYFEEAGNSSFVSEEEEERRILLDAFLLQKALYEVAYELNNRPDWLLIPVRGILSLMA